MTTIDSFSGDYAFLSNFHVSPLLLTYAGIPDLSWSMSTGEHAFQSAKVSSSPWSIEDKIIWLNRVQSEHSPAKAKYHGRSISIDLSHWNSVREDVMYYIQWKKYTDHPELRELLLGTRDATLIEGNTWGDTLWGQVNGIGENKLGEILMRLRNELK